MPMREILVGVGVGGRRAGVGEMMCDDDDDDGDDNDDDDDDDERNLGWCW